MIPRFLVLIRKELTMRINLFGSFAALSMSVLLCSGCAKDQVKPDETIATPPAAPTQTTSPQAADQQLADQAAAKEAALKAEQLKDQQAKDDEAAGLVKPSQTASVTTPQGSSIQTAEAAKQALHRINFDFDSYALSQASRDTLYNNAEYLLKKYKGKIRLEGHCDERGSDEYNLALGENRAKSAMNYLLTLGVPADQLSIVSYGEERPLDNDHTEDAWANNRRVEFEPVK